MGMRESYIDPFGAPEYLVDGHAFRCMVGTELIRFGFFVAEEGHRILRVKLVIPVAAVMQSHPVTREMIAMNSACAMRMAH